MFQLVLQFLQKHCFLPLYQLGVFLVCRLLAQALRYLRRHLIFCSIFYYRSATAERTPIWHFTKPKKDIVLEYSISWKYEINEGKITIHR